MDSILGILLFFLGIYLTRLLWRFKKNDFLNLEADRCLTKFCEVEQNWNSRGRVYTKGLAFVSKNGEKQFIKQVKLCDIGIIDK